MLKAALHRSSTLHFEFNTYIISILVIFFLQVEYKYPTAEQIVNQKQTICSKILKFEQAIKQFFIFYGNGYQMGNHVISANIGQWKDRHSQPKQKLSAVAEQRFVSFINFYRFKFFTFSFFYIQMFLCSTVQSSIFNFNVQITNRNRNITGKLEKLYDVRTGFGPT